VGNLATFDRMLLLMLHIGDFKASVPITHHLATALRYPVLSRVVETDAFR
jgi:hypothetical protein